MGNELTIGETCYVTDGAHAKVKRQESGILYLTSKNITNGELKLDKVDWISEVDFNKLFSNTTKSQRLLQTGDVLMGIIGTLGNAYLYKSDDKFGISSSVAILRADPTKLMSEFLYYIVTSEKFKRTVEAYKGGSVQGYTNIATLKSLPIPNVTLNEQKKAVTILSSLDKKIQLNKKTNQTLEQMAQALFKSWFVDFDPVFDNLLASVDFKLDNLESRLPDELKQKAQRRLTALNSLENAAQCKASLIALAHELQALSQTKKATKEATQAAEQISEKAAKTPVKANFSANPNILAQHANTHAHFPSEFEHYEQLGWIPKGWSTSSAEDEFVVKGGSTPSTKNSDFWDGGNIHWTTPKDLSGNPTKIMLDTSRKITSAGLKKITSGLLPIDTVLMSSRAPVGYLALAKVPVAINQGYIAITDAKTLSSEYTIQWLDSVMDEIKGISGGTTFAEISKKTFKSIQLVIPSKKAVEAYTEITKMYYERISACVQEINTLTETRDYLLPKLISGELQIPDVATDDETVY